MLEVAWLALTLACWRPIHAQSNSQSNALPISGAAAAQRLRGNMPALAQPDGSILVEAEEMQPAGAVKPGGWRAGDWGENYYAATFSNTFLSRKAFLGAPPQCDSAEASIQVQVARPGEYIALVRYEAAFRFQTQFRLRIEQNGRVKLDRLYGARTNEKVWAFRGMGGVKNEAAWDWGAVENMVWEGLDAPLALDEGPARITLIAGKQDEPAARRNVDAILLTADLAGVRRRVAKENFLPLDGLLTQAGDVWCRVHNHGPTAIRATLGPCAEHSPYWVHLRDWKTINLDTPAGNTSDWADVGGVLDTLNDGQWTVTFSAGAPGAPAPAHAPLDYTIEFGVRTPDTLIASIASIPGTSMWLPLAYDANTRYTRRIRPADRVLYDLLDAIKRSPMPASAKPPRRLVAYAHTFERRMADPYSGDISTIDKRYNAAIDEFIRLMGLSSTEFGPSQGAASPVGYLDIRNADAKRFEFDLQRMKADGSAKQVRMVSLGDELSPPKPLPGADEPFRVWAREQGLKPSDINPAAGSDWRKITLLNLAFRNDAERAKAATGNPRGFYFLHLYAQHFAGQSLKEYADLMARFMPQADLGANYSPLRGAPYLGDAGLCISLFRRGALTMPWSQDYAWQSPVGSPQMALLPLDLFRAGQRYSKRKGIHFYVMPHWPGNTPNSWRRMFYAALGQGMTMVNLYELRPVQAAYTENHVSLPEMYNEIRRSLHESANLEDIVLDGRIAPGAAAIWYSQAGDIWDNTRDPFAAGKRSLSVAIRHQQLGLEVMDDDDARRGTLRECRVLYLADANVSIAAAQAIAQWVSEGGRLFVSAGAGMFDEFNQPNTVMRELLGVQPMGMDISRSPLVRFEKQDLPFAETLDVVTWRFTATDRPWLEAARGPGKDLNYNATMPVLGARSNFKVTDAKVEGTFRDGTPAVTMRQVGKGAAMYCGFLPGLSYFKPAIPLRPVDRGSTDDAMAHFIPSNFDRGAGVLIGRLTQGVDRTVSCSNPLVQASLIVGPHGSAIVLSNWSGSPQRGLRVAVAGKLPTAAATLASGGKVLVSRENDRTVFTLDLSVADAVVLR